jgi:DeoR/GlpR family transcriptional regulator of sugar metabolism
MIQDASTINDEEWTKRFQANSRAKQILARICVNTGLVSRNNHIFLDCGSTFVYLAEAIFEALENFIPLTITTINADIILRYFHTPTRNMIDFRVIGGRFIPDHHAFDGSWSKSENPSYAERPIFDRTFLGAYFLENDLSIMSSITDVVAIKQQVLLKSKEVVVLCDNSKLFNPQSPSKPVARIKCENPGQLRLKLDEFPSFSVPVRLILVAENNEFPDWFMTLAQKNELLESGAIQLITRENTG